MESGEGRDLMIHSSGHSSPGSTRHLGTGNFSGTLTETGRFDLLEHRAERSAEGGTAQRGAGRGGAADRHGDQGSPGPAARVESAARHGGTGVGCPTSVRPCLPTCELGRVPVSSQEEGGVRG